MKKSLLKAVTMLTCTMLAFTGCGSAAGNNTKAEIGGVEVEKNVKVGFIYIGPVGDGGYSYAHDQGRVQLAEELGVETVIKESVPEGPEVEKVATDMIDQGCNVIFATSYGYMEYIAKLAKNI